MRLVLALGAATLAAALVGTATAAAPAAKHTAAGTTAANKSLLTLKDLGAGWQAGQPGAPGLHLSCTGWAPSGKGVVEIGAAGTPPFPGGPVGALPSQTARGSASAQQAPALWKRAVQARLHHS